jgi:hypothetical protein
MAGEALSKQDLDGALDSLEAHAIHDGPRIPVHIRVADLGDRIYLDLADDEWRVLEITGKGWRVIPGEQAPVRFRRPSGTGALPVPVRGGSLSDLREFIHTDEPGHVMTVTWIVSAMTDRGPQPVLVVGGEHGSAKSSMTRATQGLVDPRSGSLRSAPKTDRDLAVAADNTWIMSFDNLSKISADLADGLCRLSTGASFATRQLYANREEAIFSARRPVILNSIVDVVNRADLQDRAVPVHLLRIDPSERREEAEFLAAYEKARPGILGALLDVLVGALRRWDSVKIEERPRMADFYRLALAAEPDMPWAPGTFKAYFDEARAEAVHNVLESDPVAQVLLLVLEPTKRWKGSASDLLKAMNKLRPAGAPDSTWPATPTGLVGKLRRLAPALREDRWIVHLGLRDNTPSRTRYIGIAPLDEIQPQADTLHFDRGYARHDAEARAMETFFGLAS